MHGLSRFLGVLLLSAVAPAYAKCPDLFIFVRGTIDGPITAKYQIKLRVASNAKDGKLEDIKQESSIQDSKFEARAWFDTFQKIEQDEHVCSKRPVLVSVSLVAGQEVVATKMLTITKDFRLTTEGDYASSEPLILTPKTRER